MNLELTTLTSTIARWKKEISSSAYPLAKLNLLYEENGYLGIYYNPNNILSDFSNILYIYLKQKRENSITVLEFEKPVGSTYSNLHYYFSILTSDFETQEQLEELIRINITYCSILFSSKNIVKNTKNIAVLKFLKQQLEINNILNTCFISKNLLHQKDYSYFSNLECHKDTINFINIFISSLQEKLYNNIDYILNSSCSEFNFSSLFESSFNTVVLELKIDQNIVLYKNSVDVINHHWKFASFFKF